jgi:hypothetical protein
MWPPTYTTITTGLQSVQPESAGSGFDVHNADALPRLSRSLLPQWVGCLTCDREASVVFARHRKRELWLVEGRLQLIRLGAF